MELLHQLRTARHGGLLVLIVPVLLLSAGCGGGGGTDAATVDGITYSGSSPTGPDAPPQIVTVPTATSYVLTGQVVSNGSGVDNMPILVAPSDGQATEGYARTVTSGGGQFSVEIPWPSVVVVASSDQFAGAVQVSYTGSNARSNVVRRTEISTQVPVQDVTQYAIADPPTSFPPGDFSDSVASVRPHFLPAFLPLLEAFLKEAFGLEVSTHFIERLFERNISMDEVIGAIEYGAVYYDPANDSLVYYANKVAVAITSDFTVIKTLFRGPVQSSWQLLEEEVPPVIEGLAKPKSRAYARAALSHVRSLVRSHVR